MALLPIRRRRRPGWLGPLGDESMGDVFFDRLWNEWGNWFREDWAPAFNLAEREGKYTLTAELPGVDKDSISITMDGNVLTISGKKESTYEEEGSQYYMKECSYGAFSRSIRNSLRIRDIGIQKIGLTSTVFLTTAQKFKIL